jgi:hypothetical protein
MNLKGRARKASREKEFRRPQKKAVQEYQSKLNLH